MCLGTVGQRGHLAVHRRSCSRQADTLRVGYDGTQNNRIRSTCRGRRHFATRNSRAVPQFPAVEYPPIGVFVVSNTFGAVAIAPDPVVTFAVIRVQVRHPFNWSE